MKSELPVVVIGAGPVGVMAALQSAKRSQRIILLASQPSSADDTPRIEAVPISFLNLFLDLGIHPRRIGVEGVYRTREVAWEQFEPATTSGPAAAHIERPALDLELRNLLTKAPNITVKLADSKSITDAFCLSRQRKIRLIDATGRRSVSAYCKIQPAKAWAARTFLILRGSSTGTGNFQIAALAGGFVYRLGALNHLLLGIVGRKESISGSPSKIETSLYENGAGWILKGLPPLSAMISGRVLPASVQWAETGLGMRIGDAALARDTISSQGLSCGIAEALYAAAVRGDDEEELLLERQKRERQTHIARLVDLISRCRFRSETDWGEYFQFLSEHLQHAAEASDVVLNVGSIVRRDNFRLLDQGSAFSLD